MGLSAVFLSYIGLLWLATAVLALLSRSGKAADHATGGGGMGPVGGGLALAGLFALAVSVLLPGLVHDHGFDALLPLTGIAGGLLLLTVLIGPALARTGAATLPELAGVRFGRLARGLTLLVALGATAGLLIGAFSTGISLAARLLDVSVGTTALAAAAAVSLLVLPGGMKSLLAGSRLIALLTGAALFGLLAVVCSALLGNPVVPLAYGQALAAVAPAELALIEKGAVDFGVFKPFLREFLTIDRLNWALLSLSLMGALAALPPLVQATGAFCPHATRRGLAWTLTFVVLALSAVPALAALARLETYRAVASSQSFADLPAWVRRASEADALKLHGTSLALVDTVADDVAAGTTTIDAVSAAMADRGARAETIWQRLDPAVQATVLDLARRFQASPPPTLSDRWTAYVDTVVTAAAVAAGNTSGKPELASITIEPQQLLLGLPHAAGFPAVVAAAVLAIVLLAAIVLASALVATLASMLVRDGIGAIAGREPGDRAETALIRAAAVAIATVFAVAAALVPVTTDVVFVASFALAAAGLLPALILALWVPRANAFGMLAALVTGLGLATYYLAGTAIYSVSFYEAWPNLSNAGPDAWMEYEEARQIWVASEGDERAAAYADLAARTTGSLWSPGLANWFGIAPAAAPVLAIPFALLLGLLVSLLTPRPGSPSLPSTARSRDHAPPPLDQVPT